MKKRIVMALSLALLSSLALAEPASAPPKGDAKRPPMARMQNELGLTDEQVKKMREIRDQGGSRAEMQAVLTPEQQAKAAALRKAHKEQKAQKEPQAKAPQGSSDDRRAYMNDQLGLSDAQKAEMAKIRNKGGSREAMRAVLTPEQQAKFDTLRSQHAGPGAKPAPTTAVKPVPAPAAKSASTPAATSAPSPAPKPAQ